MIDCFLIVGLGSIGTRHASLVRQLLPDVKIVALRHQGADGKLNTDIDHCVKTVDEALFFRPQAAVIANPAPCHLDVALPLAEAGVHLLIEKPISSSMDGVLNLIEVCRARSLILMTGYNLRFLPSLQNFRDFIKAGKVGKILSVRAEIGQYLPSWRPDSDYRQTVSAKAALGGGVLLELSHEIDYLRWLFGDIEWVSAIQGRQSALDIDVEDTAHIVMGFSQQAEQMPVIANLNMDFIRHDTTRNCTVIGESGTLRWNALAGTVEQFEQGASEWKVLFNELPGRDSSYIYQWKHFIACITDGIRPFVSGNDGLEVLRVVEGVRRSSSEGKLVQIIRSERGSVSSQSIQ